MSERIGPYLIESRLGVGGMGVVYAARDEALERSVALKVISPQLADSAEFRTRFVREARAMASLDSPHVVQVYAHGETDGQLWIATQLIPDGDLGTMLRRSGGPSRAVALDLMVQVASGLADAHAGGLVHRDIKPANVLLRRTGSSYPSSYTAYLADFGIARRAGGDHTGLTQGVVGTPSYMAPELHTGGTPGVASDVYSMGCLLWSTLAGHAPFSGTSDYQVVSAHLEQPVPQLDGDTAEVAQINRVLRTAMAKEPGARHRDAASLRDDLRAVRRMIDEAPTVVRDAAPAVDPVSAVAPEPVPAPGPGRRRRAAIVGGVVALVASLGLGGWLVLRPDPVAGPSSVPISTASPSATPSPTPSTPTPTLTDNPETPADGSGTTTGPSTGDFSRAERATAADSFATALRSQPSVTAESADCIAEAVIDEVGLATMVEQGFFDADLAYVDQDLADLPETKAAMTSAAFACISAG